MWSEENSGNVKCTMWREDDDMTRRKEKNIEKSDRIWTTAKLPPQKMNTQISRSTRRKKKTEIPQPSLFCPQLLTRRRRITLTSTTPQAQSPSPAADASPSPTHSPQPPTHHPLLPTAHSRRPAEPPHYPLLRTPTHIQLPHKDNERLKTAQHSTERKATTKVTPSCLEGHNTTYHYYHHRSWVER